MFTLRPLLYGILAHFLQGSHNGGRQFTGARQEPMLRSHTRFYVHVIKTQSQFHNRRFVCKIKIWKFISKFKQKSNYLYTVEKYRGFFKVNNFSQDALHTLPTFEGKNTLEAQGFSKTAIVS